MLPNQDTRMNQRQFSQSHKTSFQMPIIEKPSVPATDSDSDFASWDFDEDHPLALFLSMFLILLVTYVLDRRTRHGIGRRNRPLFHLLLCTHAIAAILIFYNYIKQ